MTPLFRSLRQLTPDEVNDVRDALRDLTRVNAKWFTTADPADFGDRAEIGNYFPDRERGGLFVFADDVRHEDEFGRRTTLCAYLCFGHPSFTGTAVWDLAPGGPQLRITTLNVRDDAVFAAWRAGFVHR